MDRIKSGKRVNVEFSAGELPNGQEAGDKVRKSRTGDTMGAVKKEVGVKRGEAGL